MPMTVVVTRDVAPRFRGFLASVMLEIAPGVYTHPRLSAGVRERVWKVLSEWFEELPGSCVIMTWADPKQPARQGVSTLGTPPIALVEMDGVPLSKRDTPS